MTKYNYWFDNEYITFKNMHWQTKSKWRPLYWRSMNCLVMLSTERKYLKPENIIKVSCLVLLCDQNSFGPSKMVLAWPNWFGLNQNERVTTKMNWSSPNCDFVPKWITFGLYQSILVVTISFRSRPNHYGQVQINLVRPRQFWTNQNCFGHIEGQGMKELILIF